MNRPYGEADTATSWAKMILTLLVVGIVLVGLSIPHWTVPKGQSFWPIVVGDRVSYLATVAVGIGWLALAFSAFFIVVFLVISAIGAFEEDKP